MTIRAGFASDKAHTACLYKISDDKEFAAGIMLIGFGTKTVPAAICEDPIQNAVDFSATYLQKTFDALIEKKCKDMSFAQSALGKRLSNLNDSLDYIGRNVGVGVYLAGAVCYIANQAYTCCSFGGTSVLFWDGSSFAPLQNGQTEDAPEAYILDALGGSLKWNGSFSDGELHVGNQLLFTTEHPDEEYLTSLMGELIHANQGVFPVSIYKCMERQDLPLAVLNIAMAPTLPAAKLANERSEKTNDN